MTEPRASRSLAASREPCCGPTRRASGSSSPATTRVSSLRPFVDYLWVVRWDVDKPYTQSVLTQPKVHLAAEDGRLRVYGVSRRVFRGC